MKEFRVKVDCLGAGSMTVEFRMVAVDIAEALSQAKARAKELFGEDFGPGRFGSNIEVVEIEPR